MNRRRLLIVIIIALALLLVAFGLYRLLRSTSAPGDGLFGALPDAGEQTIPAGDFDPEDASVTVTESSRRAEGVLAYSPAADGSVTVVQLDGKILRLTSSATVSLSNTAIADVRGASFSADGKKALVVFGAPGALKASVFDTTALTWQALTGLYDHAMWGPQGYGIVWTAHDAQGRTIISLTTVGATSAATQTIATIAMTDARIAWQSANTLIAYDAPSAYNEGAAWSINIQTKVVTPLIRETLGLDLAWDPVRNQGLMLESTLANTGGSLALVGSVGLKAAQFNFLTIPAKCSFAALPIAPAGTSTRPGTVQTTNYLACGVPINQDQLARANLPDQYYQRAFFTTDRLVVVDLNTRGIIFVGSLPSAMDITDVRLAGTTAYFLSRYDNALYAVLFE